MIRVAYRNQWVAMKFLLLFTYLIFVLKQLSEDVLNHIVLASYNDLLV